LARTFCGKEKGIMQRAILFILIVFPAISFAGLPYLGHDLSSLLMLEAQGVSYATQAGASELLENILISGGTNTIRSRLWVNPTDGYCDLAYNVKLASRMQSAGLKIYIDIHFSDTWADPGHQTPPQGWPTDIDSLLLTVRNYTENVMKTFVQNGVTVDMISIGNEIISGLLWPTGKTPNYNNIGMLLKQASLGVKAGAPINTPKILIHLPSGSDWNSQRYFYDTVLSYNNFTLDDFDMQGVSFYPFYGTTATLANLNSTLTQMANKYGKEIIIAETDWYFSLPHVFSPLSPLSLPHPAPL
jgi:arabinogalactan endo-1,4-beta-galactosidase